MVDFAAIKTRARRAVHTAFAVRCLYTPPNSQDEVELSARFHNKMQVGGDLAGGGYATIIEGVTRVVFDREELAAKGLTLRQDGRVVFPDYDSTEAPFVYVLDNRDPYDGPITEKWSLAPP